MSQCLCEGFITTSLFCYYVFGIFVLFLQQTELCELREEVTEAGSEKFKLESRIKLLEQEVQDKTGEIQNLKAEVEEVFC